MKVLLIEDDASARDNIVEGLGEKDISVETAKDGFSGLILAKQNAYDVLIVDRMLPGIDGLSLVKSLRESGKQTPVLILTALGDIDDTVEGLEAGGDDYMAKPFAFAELIARLNVLAKRGQNLRDTQVNITIGDLHIDTLERKVTRQDQTINLQPKEYELLTFLAKHVGEPVTRTMLLEEVWGVTFEPQTNVVDVHISRLRTKVDRGFRQPLISTVRGVGYVLSDETF